MRMMRRILHPFAVKLKSQLRIFLYMLKVIAEKEKKGKYLKFSL
jgi:hypothetical protein